MEEQKLLKRKKKALYSGARRSLAEACGELAAYYYKLGRLEEALEEYQEEAALCGELGLRLEWGTSNRMIGEVYMMMAEFDKALKYEEKHFAVAKELNNIVEQQRALATLGRIYLLQGQSVTDAEEVTKSLKAAEKAFTKSLVLCESLKGKINMHELMDMRARLLLNIGVVLEHLGSLERAVVFIQKAISICTTQDLFEVLHQCLMTEGLLYSNKSRDYGKALGCLNKAFEVAGRLDDKVLKQCESLSLKGDILCKMSDYHSAKQVFLKAWKLNTPDENEKSNIEKNLKVVVAICNTEDLLISTDPTDHATVKKLYEKLGDGACALQNYASAIESYLKMLEHAELAGECGKSLIPIYVSLYQTYKDMGLYAEALQFYQKEYELIKDIPKEAYTTLYNIAETLYLAKKPYEQVEKACSDAREEAVKIGKIYEIRILKNLLKYQEEYTEADKMEDTKAELKLLGYFDFDKLENSEDEDCSSGGSQDQNTTNVGDDICLEDLSDLSDNNDEDVTETMRQTRKRGRGFTIKKNMKGETQLHVACISGNKLLAERLIAAGHPVNVQDNAGWLPIHEACIHGQLEITNMLINHGALINDRGGANCDGITPLYDAASNGHLELVKLLLDRGAIPSLKTDFGETPLDVLKKWRTETILNKDEEALYNNITNQIHNYIDKRGPIDDIGNNKSISKTPQKRTKTVSPPSTSKANRLINDDDVPVYRRRNVIDESDDEMNEIVKKDTSDSSENESVKPTKKNQSVKEYRNAIQALRNRNITEEFPEVEFKKSKSKPALLDPEEIDDDWLDDDMGKQNNKKRKISDDSLIISAPKKPSIESIKESVSHINKTNISLNKSNSDKSSNNSKSRISDVIDSDSSDSDSFRMTENINPKPNSFNDLIRNNIINLNNTKSNDTRQNIRKRWKKQSTLLKAGFRRRVDSLENGGINSCSSNSNSDTEITNFRTSDSPNKINNLRKESPKKGLSLNRNSTLNFSRKPSNERIPPSFTRTPTNEFHANLALQPINMIQPINVVQSGPGQIVPPAAVRVKVEDKMFLISLNLKTINKTSISWLVEEVKTRYYKLTGIRPVFSLMTSDGAILSEDDPLSLVLTSPELKTCVTNWKASPAEERYLECCEALNIASSEEIQQAIGRSHTTHRLALGARTLNSTQIRPLFRAVTHQTHLTALMLSDNNIGDDGMKYLIECLCTLKQITLLDLSNNKITSQGTELLLNMFVKATRPVCQSWEQLNMSSNPIGDAGFKHLLILSNYVKLKALRFSSCEVTENAFNDVNKPNASLERLEILDISNNILKQPLLCEILTKLDPTLLTELELENVGVAGIITGFLATFFEQTKDIKMRKFNLSKCALTDAQFMRIYRCLGRAKNLQSISLKQNVLTFITLKKLLQRQPPVPQVNLEGCHDIFKFSQDSDFQVWLPAIDFGRCIPEINVTPVSRTNEERESFKLFSKTWLNCFNSRGVIEHAEGGVVRFTAR